VTASSEAEKRAGLERARAVGLFRYSLVQGAVAGFEAEVAGEVVLVRTRRDRSQAGRLRRAG
jgi:hypothetical protein